MLPIDGNAGNEPVPTIPVNSPTAAVTDDTVPSTGTALSTLELLTPPVSPPEVLTQSGWPLLFTSALVQTEVLAGAAPPAELFTASKHTPRAQAPAGRITS